MALQWRMNEGNETWRLADPTVGYQQPGVGREDEEHAATRLLLGEPRQFGAEHEAGGGYAGRNAMGYWGF